MRAVVLVAITGCVGTVDTPPSQPPPPPPGGNFGVIATPRLGTVIDGTTSTAQLAITGVHERPGFEIDIQVLDDPAVADRWVTIASAITATQPSSTDASVYEWQAIATPAGLSPARWPQGGLVHVRAIDGDGVALAGLFDDADACLAQTPTWRARAQACGGTFASGIVLASSADLTASPTRPRYLDRRGDVLATETDTYYQTIAAPATLAAFQTQFGLDATATEATYYNASDLGIGRDMHCALQAGGGVACAVSNYGTFGGTSDDALRAAVAGATGAGGAFATVAMVFQPPIDAPNSVQFMVYGRTGALVDRAQLDTVGDNQSVPNNCLNCHGTSASYDPVVHAVSGATFLPFDEHAFAYSAVTGFTAADQQVQLAQLNQMVVRAQPSPSIQALIAGWYPLGSASAAPADFVPPAWSTTPLDRAFYRNVLATSCRGCHASLSDDLAFATTDAVQRHASEILADVCDTHVMPNAEVPLRRVWAGPARAYLAAYLGATRCDP